MAKGKDSPVGALDNIRELCSQIKVFMRFDLAVVEVLDDLSDRVARLEEDNKLLKSSNTTLKKQYSELMYAFKSYRFEKDK